MHERGRRERSAVIFVLLLQACSIQGTRTRKRDPIRDFAQRPHTHTHTRHATHATRARSSPVRMPQGPYWCMQTSQGERGEAAASSRVPGWVGTLFHPFPPKASSHLLPRASRRRRRLLCGKNVTNSSGWVWGDMPREGVRQERLWVTESVVLHRFLRIRTKNNKHAPPHIRPKSPLPTCTHATRSQQVYLNIPERKRGGGTLLLVTGGVHTRTPHFPPNSAHTSCSSPPDAGEVF